MLIRVAKSRVQITLRRIKKSQTDKSSINI
jgi:hypothetical protein